MNLNILILRNVKRAISDWTWPTVAYPHNFGADVRLLVLGPVFQRGGAEWAGNKSSHPRYILSTIIMLGC